MLKKKNMEKLYEKFIEEIEPTEEMKKLYDELSDKIIKLKSELHSKQANEIEDLEELFSKINSLEIKQSFFKGFSVATNLILESKE